MAKQVKECKALVKNATADVKHVNAVAAAMESKKAYSALQFGQGRKKGGLKEHRAARYDVLERCRRVGNLSNEQEGQWEFFKVNWDSVNASFHDTEWGKVFSEWMEEILTRLVQGEFDAFAKFVHSETGRVLHATGALVVPGTLSL